MRIKRKAVCQNIWLIQIVTHLTFQSATAGYDMLGCSFTSLVKGDHDDDLNGGGRLTISDPAVFLSARAKLLKTMPAASRRPGPLRRLLVGNGSA